MPILLPIGTAAAIVARAAQISGKDVIPPSLNLSVPSAPALDILGISASKAQQPTSLQQIALSLLPYVSGDGKNLTGLAITATPPQLGLIPSRVDLSRYYNSNNWIDRTIYKTEFSLGTANDTTSGTTVSKAALGVSIPVIDQTDWRTSKLSEFNDAVAMITVPPREMMLDVLSKIAQGSDIPPTRANLNAVLDSLSSAKAKLPGMKIGNEPVVSVDEQKSLSSLIDSGNAVKSANDADFMSKYNAFADSYNSFEKSFYARYMAQRQKLVDAEVKLLNSQSWNQFKVDVALAGVGQKAPSGDFKTNGWGAWGTVAGPLVHSAQVLAYAKYRDNIQEKIGDMTQADQVTGWTLAGRIRGGSSTDGYYAEYQYQGVRAATKNNRVLDHVFQLGLEHKLGDQWLQIGVGKQLTGGHKFVFGLNVAFDLSPQRQLPPP